MVARVARYEVPQDKIDEAVAAFGEAGAQIENLDGFAGGYVLIDREDGRTMTVTLWTNSAAMENSEASAGRIRRQAAQTAGGTVLSVEKFEVAQELAARMSGV